MANPTPQPNQTLDPQVKALTMAIRQTETGGNYTATGKSGEYGAYQFLPNTWASLSQKYLGGNVPLAQATPAQQNEVAYKQVSDWKNAGYNVGQIASMWNAGPKNYNAYMGTFASGAPSVGTNRTSGVKYNAPAYAKSVATAYHTLNAGGQVGADPNNPSSTANATPLQTPPNSNNGQLQDTGSFLGNLWNSTKNLVGGLANVVVHPIDTLTNLGKTALGAVEKVAGEPADSNTAAFDNLVHFFGQRYGGSSVGEVATNIGKTAYTDPVGFLADLSTVLTGGSAVLGTAGKVADIGKIGEVADAAKATEFMTGAAKGATFDVRQVMEGLQKGGVQNDQVTKIMSNLYKTNPSGAFTADEVASATKALGGPNGLTTAATAVSDAADRTNPIIIGQKGLSKLGEVTGITDKITGAVDSAKNIFSATPNPEDVGALGKLGITPESVPASMTNPSPVVNTLETLSSKGAGYKSFAAKMENLSTKLDDIKNETLAKAGTAQDISESGRNIAEGLNSYSNEYNKTTEDLFNTFSKKGGSKLPAEVNNTTNILHSIIDTKDSIGEDSSFFKKKLDVVTGGESKTTDFKLPTFETLKTLRTAIGDKIKTRFQDPFVNTNIGQLKQLYGALSQDRFDTVKVSGNIKLYDALKAAEDHYKEGLKVLQTGYAKQIRRFANAGQYDKIIPSLLKKSTSIDDIPKIRQVIGEDNFKQLQYHLLDNIFEGAQSISKENFTRDGIDRAIKSFGEDKVKAILDPEQFTTIKDMQRVVRLADRFKHLGEGSQTAFIAKIGINTGLAFSAIGDLLTGNIGGFVAKLSPIIGQQLVSKIVASDAGQTFLREGLKKPAILDSKVARIGGKIIKGAAKQVYNAKNLPRNIESNRAQGQ